MLHVYGDYRTITWVIELRNVISVLNSLLSLHIETKGMNLVPVRVYGKEQEQKFPPTIYKLFWVNLSFKDHAWLCILYNLHCCVHELVANLRKNNNSWLIATNKVDEQKRRVVGQKTKTIKETKILVGTDRIWRFWSCFSVRFVNVSNTFHIKL